MLISWVGYEFRNLVFKGGGSDDNVYFSKTSSADLEIFTDKMIVRVADAYSDIKNCETKSFAYCMIFDSTIIAIPNNNILERSLGEGNMFRGKDESIEFTIKKELLGFRGEKIRGYRIKVYGNGGEFIGSKGDFFYTNEKGVVSFTDFDKQLIDELPKGVRLEWVLSGNKGVFSW